MNKFDSMYYTDSMHYRLLLSFFVTASLAGCAGKPVLIEPVPVPMQFAQTQSAGKPVIKGAPDWVNRGSSAVGKQDARLIQGVGYAEPMGDLAEQKAVADDRARAEVAKILDSYLEELGKSYKPEGTPQVAVTGQDAALQQIRNTSKLDLSAARIIGSWRDPKSNTIWSVAELDIRNVKAAITGMTDLNGDVKHYIEVSAENIFDRLIKGRK